MRAAERLRSTHGASALDQARRLAAKGLLKMARYALIPDPQALFTPAAIFRSGRILEAADVLYASGMPWSSLVAAAALKTKSRRPLVLGLRDPWIEPRGLGPLRNRLESLLEAVTLAAADAIVVTAEGLRDDLVRRHPSLASKVHVITNGYDEDDFIGEPARAISSFDIVHTGNFYGKRGPVDLFAGIRRWLEQYPMRRSEARVRLIGRIRAGDRESAQSHGIEDVVVFEPPVDHREAVARLRSARVVTAIDFAPESARTRVLSKTFECMRSGRPFLFLSSGGGTADILRACPRAVIVPKEDPPAIASALEAIARSSFPSQGFVPDEYTRQFDRSVLAGRFAELLNRVMANH
jgi:glycosyltransferase involved in cell wall biosynthesis